MALIVAAHTSLCGNHIFSAGSDEQRRRYVPRLATGEWIGCWSLTEPEAGSDAAGTRTSAVREGDGWALNGTTPGARAGHCVAGVGDVSQQSERGAVECVHVQQSSVDSPKDVRFHD